MKSNLLCFMYISLLQCNLFAMGSFESDLRDQLARTVHRTPDELGMRLILAAKTEDLAEAQALIEEGADVDFRDTTEWTALMYAAARGHVGLVDLLCRRGATVDLQDWFGDTALIHAAARGHVGLVDLLCRRGANVNLCDCDRWTALMYGALLRGTEVVDILVQYGALNEHGESVLMKSINIRTPNRRIIEILLYAGASLRDLNQESMAKLKSLLPEEKNQQLIARLLLEPDYFRFAKKMRHYPLVRFLQQREFGGKI